MPPKRRPPIEADIDQGTLFETRGMRPLELDRQGSISGALDPSFAGINPPDYADVGHNAPLLVDVEPAALSRYLINIAPPSRDGAEDPNVISYFDSSTRREVYVAITPNLAKQVPRYVGAIQDSGRIAVGARVVGRYPGQQDKARETRSGLHILENKAEVLGKLRENIFVPRIALLDSLEEASRIGRAGFTHPAFKDHMATRQAITSLFEGSLKDMIHAYGRQRNLSDTAMQKVEDAFVYKFYLDRKANKNIDNFHNLVKFLAGYERKILLGIEQRQDAIARRLESTEV